MRFPVDELPHGMGSCHPIIIPSVKEGNKLVIKYSELRATLESIPLK